MGLIAADYQGLLLNLLPPGPAWPRDVGQSNRLLFGLAEELARIDARSGVLVEESDPRTTNELLTDWERNAGLPDVCDETGVALTTAQRRALLVSKLISQGGQTPQYFIDVAVALGYAITITEFKPWACDMDCDLPIYGTDWAYAWQVNAPETTRTFWGCDDPCVESLSSWGNSLLECAITRIKPSHTYLIFSYG